MRLWNLENRESTGFFEMKENLKPLCTGKVKEALNLTKKKMCMTDVRGQPIAVRQSEKISEILLSSC